MDYSTSRKADQDFHRLLSPASPTSHHRRKIQGLVPPGTVSSRVLRWQNSSKPKNQQAQPDAKPDQDVLLKAPHHSYGFSNVKPNDHEIHAMSDISNNNRLPEIKKKITPQWPRDQKTKNYIITTRGEPSGGVSETMKIMHTSPDVDKIVVEIDSTGNNFFSAIQTHAAPPSSAHSEKAKFQLENKSQTQNKSSTISSSTESAHRLESVRDLYFDHGIVVPSSLAFGSDPQPNQDIFAKKLLKICHLCSCHNKFIAVFCESCSHRLCSACGISKEDENSSATKEESDSDRETVQKSVLKLDSGDFIRRSRRPKTTPIPYNRINTTREGKKILEEDFHGNPSMKINPLQIASKSSQQEISMTDKSASFLSGRDVTKNIKESPFIARDCSNSNKIHPQKSKIVGTSKTQNLQNTDFKELSSRSVRLDKSEDSRPDSREIRSKKGSHDKPENLADLAISKSGFLKNSKEKNTSSTEYHPFVNRCSCSDVEWSPTFPEPRDDLRILPVVKSLLVKGNDEQPIIKISLHDRSAEINSDTKLVNVLQNSKEDNKQEIFEDVNSYGTANLGKFLQSTSPKNSAINHNQNSNFQSSSENGSLKNDKEKKKQRRLAVAKKVMDVSSNLNSAKLDPDATVSNGLITQQMSRLGTINFSDRGWLDLPPINPENLNNLWKLDSGGSLTDVVTQKIKGVVVTLEIDGGKNITFRANTWYCGD